MELVDFKRLRKSQLKLSKLGSAVEWQLNHERRFEWNGMTRNEKSPETLQSAEQRCPGVPQIERKPS